jgi:predicted membrane protein
MQNFKHTRSHSGKTMVGIILLLLGAVLLLKNFDLPYPRWIFSWPMFLLAIGIFLGKKNNFRSPGSLILIGVGAFFLLNNYLREYGMQNYLFPILLIGGGIWLMTRGKKAPVSTTGMAWGKPVDTDPDVNVTDDTYNHEPDASAKYGSTEDRLDSTSIFGAVKKNILSKNFRGGEVVNIMGGAEIDLMQADIPVPAVLEVTQVFGGTKIILPPHWVVHSEMAAIFGGIEDKRPAQVVNNDTQKVLTIKGTSIFGGITICSY